MNHKDQHSTPPAPCSPDWAPARAYVSPAHLRHNVSTFRRATASSAVRICATVKADAYGHDVGIVAAALADQVDFFAVYTLSEAERLQRFAPAQPILVFQPISPATPRDAVSWAAANRIHCTICSPTSLDYVTASLRRCSDKLNVHLKVDTGMGRAGCPVAEAPGLLSGIRISPTLQLVGAYTHFATADEDDQSFTREQLGRFNDFLAQTDLAEDRTVIKHACNSAAALRVPQAHFDMIRPGIGLYGYLAEELHGKYDLLPALRLEAPLSQVKTVPAGTSCGYGRTFVAPEPTLIGIVPVGYADALPRTLSNRAVLRIGSHPTPVIGRVSMDQTIIDVTGIPDPHEGMTVTVIDDNPDSQCNAQSLSNSARTIPYEILTGIGSRVRRIASGLLADAGP